MNENPGDSIARNGVDDKIAWSIIETLGSGHRLWYVSLLLHEATNRGEEVTVFTRPDIPDTEAWKVHMGEDSRASIVRTARTSTGVLREAAMEKTSRVIIPDGDRWLTSLAIYSLRYGRSLRGALIIMRPRPDGTVRGYLRHMGKALFRKLVTLLHPDLRLLDLIPVTKGEPGPYEVLDPVVHQRPSMDRTTWLNSHGLDPRHRWLVVLGDVSRRKCVIELAEAVFAIGSTSNWALATVGRTGLDIAGDLQAIEDDSEGRVVSLDGYVSDNGFDAWISHADAVAVVHRNEGSSGVLLKAWLAGSPVVVGGNDSLVRTARLLGVNGVVINDIQPQALKAALDALPTRNDVSTDRIHDSEYRISSFTEKMLSCREM
jgi:hypothetical protein